MLALLRTRLVVAYIHLTLPDWVGWLVGCAILLGIGVTLLSRVAGFSAKLAGLILTIGSILIFVFYVMNLFFFANFPKF